MVPAPLPILEVMRGRALTPIATAAVGLAALGVAAGSGAGAQDAAAAPSATAPQVEKALVKEMNRVRATRGLRGLRARATLTRPARAHSRYLLAHDAFAHEGPGGRPFWTRLVAAGYPRTRTMGENLAMTYGSGLDAARRTVRMWMGSPGHRANLLNPRFRYTGAGVARSADFSTVILTADYGS